MSVGIRNDLLQEIVAQLEIMVALQGTGYAPLASPSFTGTPLAPTAAAGTNTTQIATTAFVATALANLVASAPAALDTLNELAAALGNDANFAASVTTSLSLKAALASPAFTGVPTAPTAALGTNTTQLATTAFVQAELLNRNLAPMTLANLFAYDMTGLPAGIQCRVTDYDYQMFVWNGTVWKPSSGKLTLANKWSTIASPLSTVTGVTAGQFSLTGGNIPIPANLIKQNYRVHIEAEVIRSGATATANFNSRLGTAGTSSDSKVGGKSLAATTLTSLHNLDFVAFGSSTTSAQATVGSQINVTATTLVDVSTNINTAALMYVSFDMSAANTADTFYLTGYRVTLEME